MKTLKQVFGIKTNYAIPSDSGVDITKGKKYEFTPIKGIESLGRIKDNSAVKILINIDYCKHINKGEWEIITE